MSSPSSFDQIGPEQGLRQLAENLVRIWHFDNTTQEWTFFDPRPQFAGANSIEGLVSGEIYWINVTDEQTVTIGQFSEILYPGWNLILV